MPVPKPRAFLALRKAITRKRATPIELGYERDSKTGRLTKPGTKKLNEAVAKTVKNYSGADPVELASKIQTLKGKQYRKIELAEQKRRIDLNRRQLTNWIEKLNKGLSEYGKKTNVSEQKESLFKELFNSEIQSRKKNFKSNHVLFEEKLRKIFNSKYYLELQRTIFAAGPEKLRDIDYLGAKKILTFVEIKLKSQKSRMLLELKN